MEQHLKRRILGALVTVTAVAIALPVVLDSTRHQESLLTTDVPPMPELPGWAGVEDERRIRIELQELASGDARRNLTPPEPAAVKQDTPPVPGVSSDRTGTDQQQVPYAWTLQLGAFSDPANANALRDRLRDKGYKAYTDEFPQSGLTRVYVGPEMQRAAAERLQKQLQQELGQSDIHIKRWQPGR